MQTATATDNYAIEHFDDIDPKRCPCGFTRRAFTDLKNPGATVHRVEIQEDARTHYHKKLTEVYLILEGAGEMELDGQRFPVAPGSTILIKPGCRHKAIGKMTIVNFVVPGFDAEDEWFD